MFGRTRWRYQGFTAVLRVVLPLLLGMPSFVVTLCPAGCQMPMVSWLSSAGAAMNPSFYTDGFRWSGSMLSLDC